MALCTSIHQQAAEALARGAVVLTSNQRAARKLQAMTQGAEQILPWSAWVSQLWQQRMIAGEESRILLRRSQQLLLWQKVLAEQNAGYGTASLAELAANAADLVGTWELREALRKNYSQISGDARIFTRAFAAMEKLCQAQGWLTASYAETELAIAIDRGSLELPAEILLIGFDGMTPAQQHLANAMQAAGVNVYHAELPYANDEIKIAATRDSEDELAQCAIWAAMLLQETPDANIAIITPDPDEVRPALERALRQHLSPGMQHVGATSAEAAYEFSLGRPLSSLTMVRHALWLLRWFAAPLTLEQASEVFRSIYIGAESTHFERAEFDLKLRKAPHLSSEVSLERVMNIPTKDSIAGEFFKTIADACNELKQGARRSWPEWAEAFATMLSRAGWPGTRSLTSVEYQLLGRWSELLDEISALHMVGENVDYATALATLEATAGAMLFAPQSHNAPVHILGPLEAAGGEFDAVWFLHADDAHWPIATTAHPLLPFYLQRESHMPGADHAATLENAAAITKRILHSAPNVVASYARHSEEGQAVRLSTLLQATPHTFMEHAALAADEPLELEILDDADPLPALPATRIHGGATLLKLQAACSFRAFAETRLFSAQPESVGDGLNPMERGNIIHGVLSAFWKEVKSQEALRGMSLEKRHALLRRLIQKELTQEERSSWETAYLQIEQERVFTLLNKWLDKEAARTLPFYVESTESKVENAQIGPLTVDLRIDRIDIVTTDHGPIRLLIDYKTGSGYNAAKWKSERPDEPQLPLYAVAGRVADVGGIAFASIYAGNDKSELSGISTTPDMVTNPKDAPAFEEAIADWNHVLNTLAEEFASGEVTVNPKQFPATCKFCGQRILCRVSRAETPEDEWESEA